MLKYINSRFKEIQVITRINLKMFNYQVYHQESALSPSLMQTHHLICLHPPELLFFRARV